MRSRNKKKLLYIIDKIEYGGAQIGMTRLLNELENYDITVASFYIEDEQIVEPLPDNIEIVNLGIRNHTELHKAIPLIPHVKRSDIIIGSLWNSSITGTLLAKIYRKKAVNWQHSSRYESKIRKLSYLACYKFSDLLLADSKRVEEFLRDQSLINEDKIKKVPISGIDTDHFYPVETSEKSDETKIGTIGRIDPVKGYSTLMECARKLDSYEFHIVSNNNRKQLEQLVDEIPENVVFRGQIKSSEMPEFLKSMEVYFQPSINEGLCITVIEAMSCQLPVVASSVGGIQDSVIQGETGYKAEPKSVDEFCEYIEELAENPEKREEFGKKGRERVKENYSAEVLKEEFLEAIESV